MLESEKPQILAFSCFDPVGNQGGVSKVIREHTQMLTNAGYSYALLFPPAHIRTEYWGCLLDGQFYSLLSTDELCEMLSRFHGISRSGKVRVCEIHIHHLMRMDLDKLTQILRSNNAPIRFFVHDFYSVCPSVNLLDSSGAYCGTAPVCDEKCGHCDWYTAALELRERVRGLLEECQNRLEIIAPSEFALEVWRNSYGNYACKYRAMALQTLHGCYEGNRTVKSQAEPLRIAYFGGRMPHKGYHSWQAAAEHCIQKKCNYHLFVNYPLTAHEKANHMTVLNVNVSRNPDDMIIKLRKHQIDIMVLNSILGETYSYTFFESLAANVFVLTSQNSGNIARSVKKFGNGLIMDSPDDLKKILSDETRLREMVNSWKEQAAGPLKLAPNQEIVRLAECDTGNIVNFTQNFVSARPEPLKKWILSHGYHAARVWKRVMML